MYMYNPYSPLIPQPMYDPGKRRDKTETGAQIAPSPALSPFIARPQVNNTAALAPHIGNAPGVLMQQGQQQQPDPVLNQPFYPTPTGNMSTPEPVTPVVEDPPPPPPEKLGFGDKLMRYMSAQEARGETPLSQKLIAAGAAMQGASHLGGNAAMAAAGQAYTDLNQSDMDRKDAYAAAQAEAMQENMDLLNQYDAQDEKLTNILNKFDQFGDNVTGPIDGTLGSLLDSSGLGDAEKEAFRVEIRQTIVDSTLLNTAQTKGAISDREMALFKSGVPSMTDNEDVWRAWIKARQENLRQIKYRLANNIRVSSGADIAFDNTYQKPTSQGTSSSSSSFSQEDDDALFEYNQNQ